MAEAGKAALWELRMAIASLQVFMPRFGALLEDGVGGDADGVLDAEELAELVEQWESEAGVAAQLDLHVGESRLQTRHQAQQQGNDASMAGGVSRTQPRRQQASGVTLEDQHGVIHVLSVSAVEEAELLLAVGGIVGGVEIEQDLAALADLVAAEADELRAQPIIQAYQFAGGRRILPAAEGGVGAERVAQFLIGDDLQHGIVGQTLGVVGIFVAGDDLIDALQQQGQRTMAHAVVLTTIVELL